MLQGESDGGDSLGTQFEGIVEGFARRGVFVRMLIEIDQVAYRNIVLGAVGENTDMIDSCVGRRGLRESIVVSEGG